MFEILLIKIVILWSIKVSGQQIDTGEYCVYVNALHEIDLERAIESTKGLTDADGHSETDYCF